MTPEIPGVKGLVARLLLADPDLSTREIHGRALERYPALEGLSLREFNGRYVLQVKRNMKAHGTRRPRANPQRQDADRRETVQAPRPDSGSSRLDDDQEEGLDLLRRAAAQSRTSLFSAPPPAANGARSSSAVPAPAPSREAETEPSAMPVPAEPADPPAAPDPPATPDSADPPAAREQVDPPVAATHRSRGALPSRDVEPAGDGETHRTPREAIRILFFKLALELELVRSDSELVDVIAGLDRYVDEALAVVKA